MMMKVKITDYNLLGTIIESHIHNYIPPNWKEPIQSVMNAPFIGENEARQLLDANKSGELEEFLEQSKDKTIEKYPAIRMAIIDFFKKELHKKYATHQ